jgi:hypothetical protein
MIHGSFVVSRLQIHPISAPTCNPCSIISDGGRLRLSYDSIPKIHFQGQSRDGTFDFCTWLRFSLGLGRTWHFHEPAVRSSWHFPMVCIFITPEHHTMALLVVIGSFLWLHEACYGYRASMSLLFNDQQNVTTNYGGEHFCGRACALWLLICDRLCSWNTVTILWASIKNQLVLGSTLQFHPISTRDFGRLESFAWFELRCPSSSSLCYLVL